MSTESLESLLDGDAGLTAQDLLLVADVLADYVARPMLTPSDGLDGPDADRLRGEITALVRSAVLRAMDLTYRSAGGEAQHDA